jgi:hypothetical protein
VLGLPGRQNSPPPTPRLRRPPSLAPPIGGAAGALKSDGPQSGSCFKGPQHTLDSWLAPACSVKDNKTPPPRSPRASWRSE